MAMMMGVLVIAFPVSVFSDLWSKELRLHEAFEILQGEGIESNHGEPEPVKVDSNGAEMAYDTLPQAGHQRDTSLDSLFSNKLNSAIDDEHLIMSKEDLNNLMNHLVEIHESQTQIKAILRKYKLH
jgi:hypothetical protein